MRNFDPEERDVPAHEARDEFDAFAAPPPGVRNLRLVRVRRRRRRVRMALSFMLPVGLFFLLWLVLDMHPSMAAMIPIAAFHLVMGAADLFSGERKEPDAEPSGLEMYSRWFGFRDW